MATLGTVVGYIGGFLLKYGAAISAVSSIASTAYSMTQSPEGMSMPDNIVQLGDAQANQIDKTAMQQDSKLGKLELGEEEDGKLKRKKGKAAFKIALAEEEKAKQGDSGTPETGVQVAKPEQVGAQL